MLKWWWWWWNDDDDGGDDDDDDDDVEDEERIDGNPDGWKGKQMSKSGSGQ